jgi:cytochrome c-type biogenesis protein CcmH/NrfF
MAAFDLKDQSASVHVVVNPLVNWIWVGFGIMALGTGIALLPERAYSFAAAKLPAEAATTTTLILLLLVGLGAVPLRAQHVESAQNVPVVSRTPLERDLQKSLICMCGTCGRQLLSECQCGYAAQMRAELNGLVTDGKTRDEVVQYYIAKYGSQEPLAQPIDKGFNRLAWAVPYVLGLSGLLMVGLVAMRWSRRGSADGPAPEDTAARQADPVDETLQARLDDELRDLD